MLYSLKIQNFISITIRKRGHNDYAFGRLFVVIDLLRQTKDV